MPRYNSFAEVLEARATENPDQIAFRFVGDNEDDVTQLSSAEAQRRARAVAATLQAQPCAGERVILLCPPGLDYITAFYGCLYAGAIAVPAYPPSPVNFAGSLARIEATVLDAGAQIVITTAPWLAVKDAMTQFAPRLCALRWIALEHLEPNVERCWQRPETRPESVAFLQYTSGSTGAPKGVMITHANLLHNTLQMQRLLRAGPEDRHVCWLPPYHDMGLIAGILMVSRFGMSVTLMAPNTFIKAPMRWLQAISDTAATITGAPTFGFELAAQRISDAQAATLDLSSVRVACIAAERVRSGVVEQFVQRFAAAGFRRDAFLPCYGLAESTLMSTGNAADEPIVVRRFCQRTLEAGRAEAAGDADPNVNEMCSAEVSIRSADRHGERPRARGRPSVT